MTRLPPLSASAQRTLAYMAERLRGGFTGRFEVEVNRGGIADFREQVRPLADGKCEETRPLEKPKRRAR